MYVCALIERVLIYVKTDTDWIGIWFVQYR